MKQLTVKTVFFLDLGSGNRRGEIHAWLCKNIKHQTDWSKEKLKNQLTKEGRYSVAQTLDIKSLRADRPLCPVRAVHYIYLDRTSGRTKSWSLYSSRKTPTNKSLLLLTLHGSSRLSCYVMTRLPYLTSN